MTTQTNNEEHSRFNPAHYNHCDDCRRDAEDFIQDEEHDARLDALSEASEDDEE